MATCTTCYNRPCPEKAAKYERLRGLADTDVAFHPEVEKP